MRVLVSMICVALVGCGGRIVGGVQSTTDAGDFAALSLPDLRAINSENDLSVSPNDLSMTIVTSDLASGECPLDTVAFPTFCMDRYEAPNQAGVLPYAFQTALDGETWCNARGKRVCTEDEWVGVCQGPAVTQYPYGTTYHKSWCDDDKTWISPNWTVLDSYPSQASKDEAARLYQADPSGQRTMCTSAAGVDDLVGNVAEWVKRTKPHPPNNYAYVVKGCYWSGCYGNTPPDCLFTNPAHPPAFRSYEFGFRCCQDRASK